MNKPNIFLKTELSEECALTQIRSMLDEKFPLIEISKLFNYTVKSSEPIFNKGQHSPSLTPLKETVQIVLFQTHLEW